MDSDLDDSKRFTVWEMFIIGKYLLMPEDYINIVRLCKKYQDLIGYYKYNPIPEYDLFKNMQTQRFYYKEDINNINPDVSMYVLEHGVFEDKSGRKKSFEKDIELYLTQKERAWTFYLAIPKGAAGIDSYNKYDENSYCYSPVDCDFKICCMYTNELFSEFDLDEPFLTFLNKKIKDHLNSTKEKEIYPTLSKFRADSTLENAACYDIVDDMVFEDWDGVSEEKNDFVRTRIYLETGSGSWEYVNTNGDHSYVSIGNVLLQEDSFPEALKKRVTGLDYFDIVYDTYENGVETVGEFTYHVDTLYPKRVLDDENCIVYCEFARYGNVRQVIFSRKSYGYDNLYMIDKGRGYFTISNEDDILFKYADSKDPNKKKKNSCYYDFGLKKWCMGCCKSYQMDHLVSRMIILKFNEDRLKAFITSKMNLIIENSINKTKSENGLIDSDNGAISSDLSCIKWLFSDN